MGLESMTSKQFCGNWTQDQLERELQSEREYITRTKRNIAEREIAISYMRAELVERSKEAAYEALLLRRPPHVPTDVWVGASAIAARSSGGESSYPIPNEWEMTAAEAVVTVLADKLNGSRSP